MAFNWQTFRTRTLTSIIFAAVMLTGLLWNKWSFLILFSVIHFGCWWEYLKLVEKIHNTVFHPYIKMGLIVMGYGLLIGLCGPIFQLNGYGLKENFCLPVSVSGFAILLVGIFQKDPIRIKAFVMAAAGWAYISLSIGLMMDLRREYFIAEKNTLYVVAPVWHSIVVPCAIIFCLWINDTMAYLIGSLVGKTPLTKISPKKTVEGTLGGILLAAMISGFIAWYFDFDTIVVIIIAVVAAVTGVFGDLLESKLKRLAGVKDSGTLMPGHGGFLDRFDSMLLAIPFVWLYLHLSFLR